MRSANSKNKKRRLNEFVPISAIKRPDTSIWSDPYFNKKWMIGKDSFGDLESARSAIFDLLERSERGCIDKSYVVESLVRLKPEEREKKGKKVKSTDFAKKLKKTLCLPDLSHDQKLMLVADIISTWISLASPLSYQAVIDNMEAWTQSSQNKRKVWFSDLSTDYLKKSNPLNWVLIVTEKRRREKSLELKGNECDSDNDYENNSDDEDGKRERESDQKGKKIEIVVAFDIK